MRNDAAVFFAWLRLFFATAKENLKSDFYSILTEPLGMKEIIRRVKGASLQIIAVG